MGAGTGQGRDWNQKETRSARLPGLESHRNSSRSLSLAPLDARQPARYCRRSISTIFASPTSSSSGAFSAKVSSGMDMVTALRLRRRPGAGATGRVRGVPPRGGSSWSGRHRDRGRRVPCGGRPVVDGLEADEFAAEAAGFVDEDAACDGDARPVGGRLAHDAAAGTEVGSVVSGGSLKCRRSVVTPGLLPKTARLGCSSTRAFLRPEEPSCRYLLLCRIRT